MKTIGDLYEAYVYGENEFPDKEYFYSYIPHTYSDAVKYALSSPEMKVNGTKMDILKKFLLEYHNKLGLLTPKVKTHIDSLHKGVIIAGQQTTIFGGSGIIANKIATTVHMSELSEEMGRKLVPVFWVNTHDGIQSEITTIHLPVKQSSNSKPIILPTKHDGVAIHTISAQNFEWLENNLQVIKNNFLEFRSFVDNDQRRLFLEQIDHILTFLRETYRSSIKLSDWVTLIWGIQANIFNDYGVVFIPSSHPEIRKLVYEAYLPILKQRRRYIEEFNKATEKIIKLGLHPTTPKKAEDYVPFFLECPNDYYRITLSTINENNEEIILQGKCPIDDYKAALRINLSSDTLREHAIFLSPRLDTNQAAIQSILPVYIRVSGPGEINYNAQVIPATRSININLPIYVKYTRILYNAPWIEPIAKNEKISKYSLFNQEFFKIIGSYSKSKRKRQIDAIMEYSKLLRNYVLEKMKVLTETKTPVSAPLALYKSWQFGMYDKNHKWQEVSWPWFVMASVTGLTRYLQVYKKFYSAETPIGGIGYINTML